MSSALHSLVVVALLTAGTASRTCAADPLFPTPTPQQGATVPPLGATQPRSVSVPALNAASPLVGYDVNLTTFCPGAPRIAVPDPMVDYYPASNCPDCEINWKKKKFPAGSYVYQIYGGYTFMSEDANFESMTIGYGKHWWDGWSLNLEFTGLVGNELRGNFGAGEGVVWGGSMDLIGRWHLWVYEYWSFYWDAGIGFSELSRSVPTGGTPYNFRLNLGAGWTVDLNDRARLMFGGKWFHLSNANWFNHQNPGFDGLMIYAGIMWRL
jgi:hypothetical protein